MSEATVITSPPGALARLGPALQEYARASGRTSEQVLVKKGEDLATRAPGGMSLSALFRAQAPTPGAITRSARLRGFRLGRRYWGGSGETAGISETAQERALKLMGGHRSILAMVSEDDGRINLRGVRVGTRGRRITGGRRGTGGFAVSGTNVDLRQAGDKRLNFRAVSTIMEINLREAGTKFQASGFLLRRFRRIQRERVIRETNPRSRVSLQAEAALGGDVATGNLTLRLSSYVPGTADVGRVRSLFAQALDFQRLDLEQYLARKQQEQLRAAAQKATR